MQRFSVSCRDDSAFAAASAGAVSRLAAGLLLSCCAAAIAQPAQAQGLPISDPACPANPGAVVDNSPATGGLAISGAADCPAGSTPSAQVNDPNGIAIGNDRANPTVTDGNGGSIAIGNGATGGAAGASNAVALGTGAQAIATGTTALGSGSAARAANSVAIGGGNAISTGSVAIGLGATTGDIADPTRINQVAIGLGAAATAQNSIAVGTGSIANGPQATAIGSGASAGVNSTATGRSAIAGNSAVAYGVNANAGLRGTAFGQGAVASAVDSTAIGSFASATVGNSVALGRQTVANRGAQASYTGYGLAAPQTSVGEVSIGTAVGQRQLTGVAAGSAATDAVNVSQLTAIDAQADLLGTGLATALGGGASYDAATGALTAPNYVIQGTGQASVGAALTALDTQVTTNAGNIATNTADIATNAADIGDLETAVGAGTIGLVQQAAPGAALTVGAATDGATVSFAGTAGDRGLTGVAAGAVSAASNEAVNGSQLFAGNTSLTTALGGGAAVNPDGTVSAPSYAIQGGAQTNVGDALTALDGQVTTNAAGIATNSANIATNTADIATNTSDIADLAAGVGNGAIGLVQQSAPAADLTVGAATGGGAVSFAGTGGDRGLTGVAAGAVSAASNEAINGSQLFAGNASLAAALGGGAAVNADGTVSAPSYTVQGATRTNVGDAFAALDTQVTTNTADIATNAADIVALGTALGNGAIGLVQQAAPGAALTVGAATDGAAVSFAGTAGDRSLTGVAAGAVSAASNEAVNGSQLFAGNASLATALGGGAAVNADGTVSTPSYAIQGATQTNVGDALTALDSQVTINTGDIADLANAIGSGTVGLVQQAAPGAQITVAAGTGGSSVSFAGTGGDRVLTGVANGAVAAGSVEAVNGGQLAGTAQSVATALGGGAAVNADGGVSAPAYTVQGSVQTSVGGALTALDSQVTANTGAIAGLQGDVAGLQDDVAGLGDAIASGTVGLVQQAAPGSPLTVGAATDGDTVDFSGTTGDRLLTGVGAGTISGTSTDAVNGSQLAATNQTIQDVADLVTGQGGGFSSDNSAGAAIPQASGADSSAGGNGAVASGAQATAVGNASSATGAQATAIGNAASASGANSVALGAGSSDEGEDNVVSVGSAEAQRRITNVAAGVDQTDAVNVGQLASSMGQTLASANAYTDSRFAALSFDIDEVRRDGEGATAASMALAGIPQSFERGMGMVGMGVGTWQGESAVALGISKATDSGRVVFKAGATYSTRGQGGANGGVGFAF